MQTSSLRKNRPHLESVLGPLSKDDDASIRFKFDEVDGILLSVARRFGRTSAGWEATGLELSWMPSGQTAISSFVSASIDDKCIDFCIELRPSWHYGDRSPTLTWKIVTEIYADCQHSVDHGGMDTVHESSHYVTTPLDAANALHTSACELLRLAAAFPLEHWLALASDHLPSSTASTVMPPTDPPIPPPPTPAGQ
jgi:hypothetical protein